MNYTANRTAKPRPLALSRKKKKKWFGFKEAPQFLYSMPTVAARIGRVKFALFPHHTGLEMNYG